MVLAELLSRPTQFVREPIQFVARYACLGMWILRADHGGSHDAYLHRCASVIAATPVRCLVMSKKTFLDRFLAMKEAGPLLNQALISHAFKTYQNVARASEMYSATAQQQQQVPGLDRSNSQSSMGSGCGDD